MLKSNEIITCEKAAEDRNTNIYIIYVM